ncbi:MAG: sigma-54 dependent transcriptional regulator [Rikenellaceae bacterium]
MSKVLILDLSKSVRKSLSELLRAEEYSVVAAENYDEGEKVVVDSITQRQPFSLLLVNVDQIELTGALASLPFIAISATPSIEEAMAMARRGAIDYLCRPFDINRLLNAIRLALSSPTPTAIAEESYAAKQRNSSTTPHRRRESKASCCEMIGESDQIKSLRHLIDKVAPSDARVMILGENGTGKELVARYIHNKSNRRDSPFIEVNCAAIPSELIESELFGHEKGAFTSAIKRRCGKFEQANGGTLFLDEIGDMSLAAQAKVLRALQERKICRVGSDHDIDVNVRVIAATNKDVRHEIDLGNFREDLYHRIGVIVVRVTPLRDRSEDIPLLVRHFLKQICLEYKIEAKSISNDAIDLLKGMRWSGNIRELRNVVERLIILSDEMIEASDVISCCEECEAVSS